MADTKVSAETTVSVPILSDTTYWLGGGNTSNKITGSLLLALAGSNPGGRLTLTTAVPVTTADVTGATTIYYTPYKHNVIVLWDGSAWQAITFAEVSLALGTLSSGKPYDVFGFLNAGALNTELLAWTNGTTRATAVTFQDGRYCKSGDKTRLYLGSFYTTATTTTEDSGGGTTTQVGGKRFVWNMYNRVRRPFSVFDSTASWAYTTATIRQANAASGNKCEFFLGLAEDEVTAGVYVSISLSGNTVSSAAGVGLDTTTAFSSLFARAFVSSGSAHLSSVSRYDGIPAIGYHYLSWNEIGADTTCTFISGAGTGANPTKSGLTGIAWT